VCRLHASKVTESWNGNAPDLHCAANFRFGSNSVNSDSLSMRRPRNLLMEREVVPTPMGPAEGAEGGQPHLDRSIECRADRARPYRVTECAVMVAAQNEMSAGAISAQSGPR